MGRSSESPAKRDFGRDSGRDAKREGAGRDFQVWGRRPVEAFLSDLTSHTGELDVTKYSLHIIHDKSGKVPLQLKPCVDLSQALGLKIKLHKSEEDEWPLNPDDALNHQRICLRTPNLPTSDITEALNIVRTFVADGGRGCVGLVLDQIQDPRNFGAILRSAAYFNVRFVVYATDRQSELTPLVVRTSAGGVFSLKLVPVVNISRALQQLKAAGAWTLATTLEEASPLSTVTRDRPFVLVMGNEGKGVRLEVARQSDMRVKIPGGAGTVDSLNVAVATGVCLSALSPQVDTAAAEESAEEDFEEAENIYVGDDDEI